jgi:hypothetical protein
MIKNIARFVCAFAVVVLVLGGCSSRPGVVGKWTANLPRAGLETWEFKADKTLVQSPSNNNGMNVIINWTYSVTGDKIALSPVSASVNGTTMPVPATVNRVVNATYKLDGDTLTLIINSHQIIFKRAT